MQHNEGSKAMKPMTLTELIAARIAAKRAEDAAVAARREVDAELAILLKERDMLEGTVSAKENGFKISVTYKLDRKVDTDKLQADWSKLSAAASAAFKWKADVSVSALRKLEGADAQAAAAYITTKPATPSITIEAI
jgi:predicted NUDIX family NTP pyrophosphohydrolase